MKLTFKIYHEKKWLDITNRISEVEWSDSLENMGKSFNFKVAYSAQDPYYHKRYYLGDRFLIKYGKNEILRGVITGKGLNDGSYSGHDLAYYLTKNEAIVQYKKISASKAIKALCSKYGVPIGTIPNLPTTIKKIYKDVTVADIIKDILKKVKNETGKSYRVEMNKGKLCIRQSLFYKIDPYYVVGKSRYRCSSSIVASGDISSEDLKNRIVVAGSGEKKKQIKAVTSNSKSIKRYGTLTEVVTGDKMTAAKARNIANNKLKAKNRTSRNINVEMLGNPYIVAGRRIYINKPQYGLKKGYYNIKSTSHSWNNGVYKVSADLR